MQNLSSEEKTALSEMNSYKNQHGEFQNKLNNLKIEKGNMEVKKLSK